MSESIESLGERQRERFAELEQQIEEGLSAFVRLGEALTEIRDDQLYRSEWSSFQEYCEDRWDISRGHAYRLIEAAEVVKTMREASPEGDTPKHETHARALAPLKHQPTEMVAAWQKALAASGGTPTAQHVEQAVEARQTPQEPPGEPASEPASPPGGAPPTPIEAAVRDSLPDNQGRFHLSTGQLERLLSLSEADDNGLVRIEPTGRAAGELECGWRVSGERKRIALNRHGNSPPLAGAA